MSTSFAAEVVSALRREHHLADQKLEVQMTKLLVGPWQKSAGYRFALPPIYIILDALDENDVGIKFVRLLVSAFHAEQLPGLRVLLTSRPEPAIEMVLGSDAESKVRHLSLNFDRQAAERTVLDADILRYLTEELPAHKDTPHLTALANVSAGLFIYASTAVLLIRPDPDQVSRTWKEEKELIVGLTHRAREAEATSDGHTILYSLYKGIIDKAFGHLTHAEKKSRTHILITFIISSRAVKLDFSELSTLADVEEDLTIRVLESLRAVLYTDQQGNILCYHASFDDYILQTYEVDWRSTEYRIIQRCWGALIHRRMARASRRPWELKESEVELRDALFSVKVASIWGFQDQASRTRRTVDNGLP